MNILLRGVVADHRSDTHVPGIMGLNSMGFTTPLASFLIADPVRILHVITFLEYGVRLGCFI